MAVDVMDMTKGPAESVVATQDMTPAEAVVATYRQLVLGDTDLEEPPSGAVPDVTENAYFFFCGKYGARKSL